MTSMTISAPTLVPIFATPFLVVSVDGGADMNAALVSLFLSRATEQYRDRALRPDPLCFRSREELFEWPDEAVGHLRRQMLAGICAAVRVANLYTDAEFDALRVHARARFAIVRPDGSIPAATAPMASWYAVYCLATPPPAPARGDSGVLRLYGIRDAKMFMDAANWRLRAPFEGAHCVWRPVAGQMAVFPASILHEVALNRAEADLLLVTARLRFAHVGQAAMPPW
jgi:hypothetical protein